MASAQKYNTKHGQKWRFQLFLGRDKNGKQQMKSGSGYDTKKEALTAANALEKQIQRESLLDNQYLTFNQVYDLWFENYKLTVKISSAAVTEQLIKRNLIPLFDNQLVTEISTTQCQEAINDWFNRPLKNYGTIFNYLKRILGYAVQMKYIISDPTAAVIIPNARQQKTNDLRFNKPQKKQRSGQNYFTLAELKTFLDHVKKSKNKMKFPLFRLLAFTGARTGEICALTWSDIDFSSNSIVISKTRASGPNGLFVQTPKTEHSKRIIYIDDKTKNILKEWQITQRKIMLVLGYNTLDKQQLVFSNQSNKLLAAKTVSKWLKKGIDETKLKIITPHGFRHTYATLAIQGGMSPKELQQQLGHSDIKTTLNIYTSVTGEQMEAIPDKFTAFVNI